MSEIIYTYPIDNPDIVIPMERNKFYAEQSALTLPTRYAGVIHWILINTNGEILLQQRAENKWHNPWMYDKSFGWHIQYWSTAYRTIQEETIQELWIPCFHTRDKNDFIDALRVNKHYLSQVAITQHIGQSCNIDIRLMNGKEIAIWNKTDFFIWVSNARASFNDWEVQWTTLIRLEDLRKKLSKDTKHRIYTIDLQNILETYKWHILDVMSLISKL